MSETYSSLCILPWLHVYVGVSGSLQSCCIPQIPQKKLSETTPSEFLHHPSMHSIRRQMLKGQWPEQCLPCKKSEELGLASFRLGSNQLFKEEFDSPRRNPSEYFVTLRSVDLRFSNTCNLKCRSCNGFSSSAWRDEHNLIYPDFPVDSKVLNLDIDLLEKYESLNQCISDSDLSGLKEISFAGGEPLLIEAQYKFLERLIQMGRTDIILSYTTNLSRLNYKHWNVLELWQQFENENLHLSLDGVGEKGEYIRQGLDWERWLANVQKVRQLLTHVRRDIHFVVSVFNILDLAFHTSEIIRLNIICSDENGNYPIGFTCLDWPPYLDIQVLPSDLKTEAKNRLYEYIETSRPCSSLKKALHGIIQYMGREERCADLGASF
ncbi:twitch domain-containing radical SAM protein [Hahella ganghwensis]|uniref:twitch domain-containing radical SAM protein n=1 Tax=Hahella ganghwensis TaxID=286420 RepID=UPI0003A7C7E8|nr:twitch domain-containing radical SAM protein [Hahella ganghwensis]